MNINRNNYEEYFILYTDNELSQAERTAVEQFVQENPDLQDEFQLFLQTRLPEDEVIFDDKASLLKSSQAPVWEEWMLLEMDGELDTAGRLQLEEVLKQNPAAKHDWESLLKTRLQADTSIVFPDKTSLYRKEHSTRVVFMRRIRIAAAAVLLLAIGATTVQVMRSSESNSGNDSTNVLAGGAKVQTGDQRNNADGPTLIKETDQSSPSELNKQTTAQQPVQYASGTTDKKYQQADPTPQSQGISNAVQYQDQAVAANGNQADNNPAPRVRPAVKVDDLTPIIRGQEEMTAAGSKPNLANKIDPAVTFASVQPSQISNPADEALIANASENDGKKNKFRGFFRKVTRTFEKKTNIDVTDGQDQLLIAGFAIKM